MVYLWVWCVKERLEPDSTLKNDKVVGKPVGLVTQEVLGGDCRKCDGIKQILVWLLQVPH